MTSDRKRSDTRLSDAAIDWLVRLHSGRATQADRDAFSLWRGQSVEHELAAQEAEDLWRGIGPAGERVRTEHKAARRKMTRRAVITGGSLAVGGLVVARSGLVGPHLFADYATRTAEQREIGLPDGSRALLNAGTALSLAFAADARRLVLHRGQASFTVAPDTARPFIVESAGGEARALGTVFDMDMRPSGVVVTVLEGRVAVASGAGAAVTAGQNQRVRYMEGEVPSAAEEVDATQQTAWRRGKLIFDRRPLGDVIAEIERYRNGRMLAVNPRIGSLEVTGVFDLKDPDSILDVIEETLPVRMLRLPFVTILA